MQYPDQVVNKRTAGIPYDVELARDEVSAMRTEVADARDRAEAARDDAEDAQDAARASATEAERQAGLAESWATAKAGISLGPDEPPDATAGSVWLHTADAASRVVDDVRRYDPGLAGTALFPGEDVFPSDDLYPNDMGAWESFRLADALVQK